MGGKKEMAPGRAVTIGVFVSAVAGILAVVALRLRPQSTHNILVALMGLWAAVLAFMPARLAGGLRLTPRQILQSFKENNIKMPFPAVVLTLALALLTAFCIYGWITGRF
jgi:hypothetical protein